MPKLPGGGYRIRQHKGGWEVTIPTALAQLLDLEDKAVGRWYLLGNLPPEEVQKLAAKGALVLVIEPD